MTGTLTPGKVLVLSLPTPIESTSGLSPNNAAAVCRICCGSSELRRHEAGVGVAPSLNTAGRGREAPWLLDQSWDLTRRAPGQGRESS